MNSLNLMVSTIANTRVKVLSTQVHSDRINQFDYLTQQHCIQMEI
jgi:hypothetical protein